MTDPRGLRERKRQRTEAELVDSALRLFGRSGFAGGRVEVIADDAGVSPRTFFRFFGSKEDVVLAVERVLFDAFVARMAEPRPGPLVDALRIALTGALAERETDWYPRFAASARIIDTEPSVTAAGLRLCAETTDRLHERVRAVLGPDGPPEHVVRMTLEAAVAAWRLARADWLAEAADPERLGALVSRNCDAIAELPAVRVPGG